MSELLSFLQTHEEAFRSRARLASLYSDFRHQKSSNPDGYQANASAWLRALTAATKAGLIPSQTGTSNDHFVLHCGPELSKELQTSEYGRPLALGAAIQDAVKRKDLIQLKEFLDAKQSVYAKSWIPTPWQILSWGLRQLGVIGDESDGIDERVATADFVVMANVEAASKAVMDEASKIATSNTSRIFTKDLFISTFSTAAGVNSMSPVDTKVLLTHLSRDRSALSYSPSSDTIKLKAPTETQSSPISNEDVSIAKLRALITSLEPQIGQLTKRLSDLDARARDAVTNKQLTTAKSLLRSKKLADSQLQQRTATLTSLEEVYAKIEQAADQVEIVRVMEASSKTLQSLNKQTGGVEKVQDVMDGLKDEMMTVDEIGQTINEINAGEIDEGEVDDELEALERVERENVEEAERNERERVEAEEAEKTRLRLVELEKVEKEKVEAEERKEKLAAEEVETRAKLDELDRIVDAGTPPISNEPEVPDDKEESKSAAQREQVAT